MGLGIRRTETSCFCADDCPAGTRPFKQYWVKATAPTPPQYSFNAYLYRLTTSSPGLCVWQSVSSHLGPTGLEQLSKTVNPPVAGQLSYRLQLLLFNGVSTNIWERDFITPLPEGGTLVDPEAANSCSASLILIPHFILGAPWYAYLTPAYPDACVDADFPAKEQRKLFAPY